MYAHIFSTPLERTSGLNPISNFCPCPCFSSLPLPLGTELQGLVADISSYEMGQPFKNSGVTCHQSVIDICQNMVLSCCGHQLQQCSISQRASWLKRPQQTRLFQKSIKREWDSRVIPWFKTRPTHLSQQVLRYPTPQWLVERARGVLGSLSCRGN